MKCTSKILTRNYLQRTAKQNLFTFGYGMGKIDMFNTLGGSEYFITAKNEVFQLLPHTYKTNAFIFIGLLSEFKNY
jgi:hypothetical protein